VETGTATVPLQTPPVASPVADCEWQRRLGDLEFELGGTSARALAAYGRALAAPAGCLARSDEARLCTWLGALALGGGRATEALDLLDRALARGAPRDATTLSNRALALEASGRGAEAAAAWAEVEAVAPGTALAARARERRRTLAGERVGRESTGASPRTVP
jgi:tetratricopeptide (TPR) repeat protein